MTTIEQEVALLIMHWKECDSFEGCTVAVKCQDDDQFYSITMSTPSIAKDAIDTAKAFGYYIDMIAVDEDNLSVTFIKDKMIPYRYHSESDEQWTARKAEYDLMLSEVQEKKAASFFVGEP